MSDRAGRALIPDRPTLVPLKNNPLVLYIWHAVVVWVMLWWLVRC
jgi:hypothetical protein